MFTTDCCCLTTYETYVPPDERNQTKYQRRLRKLLDGQTAHFEHLHEKGTVLKRITAKTIIKDKFDSFGRLITGHKQPTLIGINKIDVSNGSSSCFRIKTPQSLTDLKRNVKTLNAVYRLHATAVKGRMHTVSDQAVTSHKGCPNCFGIGSNILGVIFPKTF